MGGKSGNTQTSSTEPWAQQQPYITGGYREAQRIYNQGPQQYFPGATYVPFSPQTQAGLGQTEQLATQGSPESPFLTSYVTNTLNSGVNTAPVQDFVRGQLSGPVQSFQDRAQQTAGAPNLMALGNLAETASGQMLNSNPYLDQTYDRAAQGLTRQFTETTNPAIQAMFSRAGRTGSNAQAETTLRAADTLGDDLAGLATNIYGGNYAQERQNQLGAANSINNQMLQSSGQDIQRLGLASGLYGQDQSAQLNAANIGNSLIGQQYNNLGRAAALAPTSQALRFGDADRLREVGGAVEGQARNILDDQINRHNFNQQQPWQNLQNYISAIQGHGNVGSQTTQTGPSGSRAGNVLGGAATAGGLASALGATGPLGWGIAGLGGLLGLFS